MNKKQPPEKSTEWLTDTSYFERTFQVLDTRELRFLYSEDTYIFFEL